MFQSQELWIALLMCDASFPGGSLANSQGLESAVLHGVVVKNNLDTLLAYIDIALEQATISYILTIYNM